VCFCLLKFSVALCILLLKKLESMLCCVRVNIILRDNYPAVPLVTDNMHVLLICFVAFYL